jgi:hypothetical protein
LSNGLDPDLLRCEVSSRNEFESQRFDDIQHIAMARNFCLINKARLRGSAAVCGKPA